MMDCELMDRLSGRWMEVGVDEWMNLLLMHSWTDECMKLGGWIDQ